MCKMPKATQIAATITKSEEGVVALVIACLSTAKFLEAIKETLYHIPPFIRLFIKRPWPLCVHFRRIV